jgi:hypothetical protein
VPLSCRAASRTLTQTYSTCVDYTDDYELIDTWEVVSGVDWWPKYMGVGQDVGSFFVVGSAQVTSRLLRFTMGNPGLYHLTNCYVEITQDEESMFSVEVYDPNPGSTTLLQDSGEYLTTCFDGVVANQCPYTSPVQVYLYCQSDTCSVRVDLYKVGSCSDTEPALAPTQSGSSESITDNSPTDPDLLSPVPTPVPTPVPSQLDGAPSSPTDSSTTNNESSSSGVSVGVIVGAAVGGVVLLAVLGGEHPGVCPVCPASNCCCHCASPLNLYHFIRRRSDFLVLQAPPAQGKEQRRARLGHR